MRRLTMSDMEYGKLRDLVRQERDKHRNKEDAFPPTARKTHATAAAEWNEMLKKVDGAETL